MPPRGTVQVTFVDARTGSAFARSDMPSGQLPESFAAQTTLEIGDDDWFVERADPLTAAEAAAAGELTLTLRRAETISPHDILFSLPTLCDALPPTAPGADPAGSLELHEDSWRQVELASLAGAPLVSAEFDAIRRIYGEHAQHNADGWPIGFRKVHVRSLVALGGPLPWQRLAALLPAPARRYSGVRFRGSPDLVAGGFAAAFGSLTCYGLADGDQVSVLGLDFGDAGEVPVAELAAVLRACDVAVVDWCRCAMVDADSLDAYLRDLSG